MVDGTVPPSVLCLHHPTTFAMRLTVSHCTLKRRDGEYGDDLVETMYSSKIGHTTRNGSSFACISKMSSGRDEVTRRFQAQEAGAVHCTAVTSALQEPSISKESLPTADA